MLGVGVDTAAAHSYVLVVCEASEAEPACGIVLVRATVAVPVDSSIHTGSAGSSKLSQISAVGCAAHTSKLALSPPLSKPSLPTPTMSNPTRPHPIAPNKRRQRW